MCTISDPGTLSARKPDTPFPSHVEHKGTGGDTATKWMALSGPKTRSPPRTNREDLEHTQVISHDNHALGTAHAFARVTAKTDLAIGAPTRSVFIAPAVASLRARFSHSGGINVALASLGLCARTCERYHGLLSPGARPTASSQTLSASPTGLRARWAGGLMVLGTTKCLHETRDGRFSSASRSPWSLSRAKWSLSRAKWSLRRAKWSLRRAQWPSARIGLPMATSRS